jgi:polyisoprenoid-binding protein YceI
MAMALMGTVTAMGAGREFDFTDPKGVNGVQFHLDAPLEPIIGFAGGVSGRVHFDPAAPEKTSGFIEVMGDEISFVNPMMTQAARGADWLHLDLHPDLRFDVAEVVSAKPDGDGRWILKIRGEFECRGVKKPLTVDVSVHHMPGRMGERVQGADGDLLVLRAEFSIRRSDFGLKKDPDFLRVADEVRIRLGIVGHGPK